MKLKIGVMGSATGFLTEQQRHLAYQLGRAIAECDCVTITGACPGLPLESARGAKAAGGFVVGISPALSEWEHIYKYDSPIESHDVLIYTGSGLMGREVVNIRSSDIVIIIGGRSGTLGEFSIAYDEGKLIGVLLGSGGITSEIETIVRIIRKKTGARLIYNSDPLVLVRKLTRFFNRSHYRHPNVHEKMARDERRRQKADGVADVETGIR